MSTSTLLHSHDPPPIAVRAFPLVLALGGLTLGGLLLLHSSVGTVPLTPMQVWAALLNQSPDPLARDVVWGLRLPRALVGMLAGAMLGLAGAILQTITRNPLADPSLLGVTAGGVLAIVISIVAGQKLWGNSVLIDAGLLLPLLALVGGMGAGLLSYALSWHHGTDPVRLVLAGVLVNGMCGAATSLLLLWANEEDVQRIIRWTIGSLNGRVWMHWYTIWPIALVALPLGWGSAALANVLYLGDGVAAGLGLRVERVRLALVFVAALLTASAVAVVGNLAFVGLIGPHIARRLVNSDTRRLFPLSALVTAGLLLFSDLIARIVTLGWVGGFIGLTVPETAGLPVGAVTALLGAPFFLWLLIRRQV